MSAWTAVAPRCGSFKLPAAQYLPFWEAELRFLALPLRPLMLLELGAALDRLPIDTKFRIPLEFFSILK